VSEPQIPAAQVFKRYLPPTQNWIYEQLRVLRDFKPVVLAYRAPDLEQFPIERIVAVRSGSPLRQIGDRLFRRWLGYYPSFAAAVRAENAVLLHAHFGHSGVESVALARVLRLPLLVSFYGVDLWRDRGDQAHLQTRYARLFEGCTFAIAEGPVARRRLIELGCPEAKTRIHPLGVDLARIHYADRPRNTTVRVLAAARFTEKKGLAYAVEAFCRAAAEEPELRLTVVGDAKKNRAQQRIKARLHRLVEASGMSARVRFAGKVPPDELHRLLYEHDVLVQPSVRAADGDAEGGLPVILLEAAASGMPLIGSRHCDIPEIVVDGQTGWLCEERDIAGLAAALLRAARDPVQRDRFGRNARQRVEQRFDIHQRSWDGLYREALALPLAKGWCRLGDSNPRPHHYE
jgi:colanic acid/amylovoran biosynthesis glycosyltransferase